MSEDVRQATCVAATDAKCLTPLQEGFVRMLGILQGLLDGPYLRAAHLLHCNVVNAKIVLKQERSRFAGNLEHPKQPVQNIHTMEQVQNGKV